MLNTSILKKEKENNLEEYGIIKNKEGVIQEGMRKIEEQTNDEAVINSFHTMEPQIFGSIKDSVENNNENKLINNFNFSNIRQQYSNGNEFNKDIIDDRKLLITINEKINKISVYNESSKLLGFFTIDHIIKYIADIHDTWYGPVS